MILPIVAYGDPVLKKVGAEIDADYPGLNKLIEDMFETMYNAKGVGLAAPQVGKSIRLFIVDATPFSEDPENDEEAALAGFKKIFINPKIREDVMRKPELTIEYLDENFQAVKEVHKGLAARIIQHEYDHIEGKLFTDRISPLRRKLLQSKLTNITKGKIDVDYRMKFPK
jgi:peptide deformylase